MKQLLLAIIRMYWNMVPIYKRGPCLFKKTCSHYIYDQTVAHGFIAGIKAFLFRYLNCRGGFSLFKNPLTGETQMVLRSNKIIGENEIAPRFLRRAKSVEDWS
ncbi:MAG: membrane protein insertion efficiency factor YidD [Gillisia sp.]|nr:membrane protein insertion efficiency factor YidD [Gillisia sp.]